MFLRTIQSGCQFFKVKSKGQIGAIASVAMPSHDSIRWTNSLWQSNYRSTALSKELLEKYPNVVDRAEIEESLKHAEVLRRRFSVY